MQDENTNSPAEETTEGSGTTAQHDPAQHKTAEEKTACEFC